MQISAFQAYPGIAPTQGLTADPAVAPGGPANGGATPTPGVSQAQSGAGTGASTQDSPDDSKPRPLEAGRGESVSTPNGELDEQALAEKKALAAAEQAQLVAEQKQIEQLAERDREVRAHEQAHAAVGGQYAGSPVYDYTRGPNGRNYASSGHVKIDVSAIPGDPEATLQKAQTVRRAALAPAEPSSADRSVAARASQMAVEARAEIARNRGRASDEEQSTGPAVTAGVVDSDNREADAAGAIDDVGIRGNSPYRPSSNDPGSLLDTTV